MKSHWGRLACGVVLAVWVGVLASGGSSISYTAAVDALTTGDTFKADIHWKSMKDTVKAVVNGRLGNSNIASDAIISFTKMDSTTQLSADKGRIDTLTSTTITTRSGGSISVGSATVQGASGGSAILYMAADSAEDNNDAWRFRAVDGGKFQFGNYAAAAYDTIMKVTSAGYVTFKDTVEAEVFKITGSATYGAKVSADTVKAGFLALGGASDVLTATDTLPTGGTLTPKSSFSKVKPYGAQTKDTITAISSSLPVGTIMVLTAAGNTDTLLIADGATIGVASTITIAGASDNIVLFKSSTSDIWIEISRTDH
jgi:hypothetical protein